MIWLLDRDPLRFCHSELDPDLDFISQKLNQIRYGYSNYIDHCSKMLNLRGFTDINWIGSNIWTGLPD